MVFGILDEKINVPIWIGLIDKIFHPSVFKYLSNILTLLLIIFFLKYRGKILKEEQNPFFRLTKIFIFALLFYLLVGGMLLSFAQYSIWKIGNYGLLPPHQSISYFLGYAWYHFFKASIFSMVFSFILFSGMVVMNRMAGNRFFYKEEPYLAAFGALSIKWPIGILVMGLVLFFGLLFQLIFKICSKSSGARVPLLYFWLPAIVISLVFGDIISKWVGLMNFRV
jgi:hypothetical protein